MSDALLFDRQRDWFRTLMQQVKDRNDAEVKAESTFREGKEKAEKEVAAARQALSHRRGKELAACETKLTETTATVTARSVAESAAADKELSENKVKLLHQFDDAEDQARNALQEAEVTANSVFEAGQSESMELNLKHQQHARDALAKVQKLWQQTDGLLARSGLTAQDVMAAKPAACPPGDAGQTGTVLNNATTSAEQFLDRLVNLFLPKMLPVGMSGLMFVAFCVVASIPAAFMQPRAVWLFGGVFTGMVLFAVVRGVMGAVAARQVAHLGERLARALELAEAAATKLKERAEAEHDVAVKKLHDTLESAINAARGKYQPQIDAVEERRVYLGEKIVDAHRTAKETAVKRRDADLTAAQDANWSGRNAADAKYDADRAKAEAAHKDRMAKLQAVYDQAWAELTKKWRTGVAALRAEHAALRAENDRCFPPWANPVWPDRTPPGDVPRGIRLGDHPFDLAKIPDGVPKDNRVKLDQPLAGRLPAFLPFPAKCSVLLKARDQGRGKAVQILQATMLRFLTALPPGKVRFTVVDPVGLGDNFAAFMHLADYDEQLIASRIWTEATHIDQQLSNITGHMEDVIQKYLRHQFKTIEEYNEAAGEVAEPYRVLVIANFPTNFTADAARRLVSIVNSGSSCGVFTLVSVDSRMGMPHGFALSDLEQACLNLVWENDKFIFKDEVLEKFDLAPDGPPDPVSLARIIHAVGAKARDAHRVEVPFDMVAPPPDKVWAGDTRNGITVAVGRAGATKIQSLNLGRGTSQHGLIAGKTGSGKSTLLHAIITNLSLIYSPDEIELYLIDFKKGVEFKPYAEQHLPHARVIAIESEREFGLSVLQRLDAELKIRGDKYRTAGANDVASYRAERPAERLPRILLIVDEFQEFFVEDDKLAQEAALLLDRLVRQGRAFGLHVLLGSQTLGGAYSLARSTIDQMAVRIALQCSEADANLILSKDNSAARLLSRPGEAIYNDANGLIEGNDLFQVVWLPDERREVALVDVHKRAEGREALPQLVFEGNAPAEIGKNGPLDRLLRAADWPTNPRAFAAWLGEAIAIKDPTNAVFRPQSGSHLLMIGQHEDAALSILTSAILSLASHHRPDGDTPLAARFHVLDGTPADDINADYLAKLTDGLPHPVQSADMWGIAPTLTELADLVTQRQARTATDRSTRYLIIQGIQRYRDLRKSDEDFGFRRGDKAATPAENFALILRDGPTVGVHLLMWCDTLTNVNRSFDRTMLRECTQRVLFQMSSADSSHLIDSPAASRLGRNRALFHREEQEMPEKFRPYGLPPADWLAWAKDQLRKRAAVAVGAG
jgi:ABC-type multidrug transport system fused ATPase/permease subunit